MALTEILPAASAGKGHSAEEQRKSKLDRDLPHSNQSTGQRAPCVGGDDERHTEGDHDADGDNLDEDQPLERDVHNRRQRQRRANDDQPRDRDVTGIAAKDVSRQRRGAQNPPGHRFAKYTMTARTRPQCSRTGQTCERGLARGKRVALDLHVQKELRHDAQYSAPEKHEACLRGNERPQDELTRRQPHACSDQARTNDGPETVGRIRKISDDERG